MKNLFFLAIIILSTLCSAQTQFSNGYQIGYKKGYCYQAYGCIPPTPPISPMPKISESYNNYEDGYQRGFLDGKEAKGQSNSVSQTKYTLREYGDFIEPYNYELLYTSLNLKQKQYRNQQKKLYKFYSQRLFEVRDHSFDYYNKCIEYVNQFQGYYKEAELHQKQIKFLSPQRLINEYPNDIPFDQVEELIEKLKLNEQKLKGIILNIDEISKWYLESPNKIIQGVYSANNIEDSEYNPSTGNYELKRTTKELSHISFTENTIQYKRSDKNIIIGGFLRFEGVKNGAYIFIDGWDNTIALTKNFKTVQVYFNRETQTNQYLKKATYNNLSKIE